MCCFVSTKAADHKKEVKKQILNILPSTARRRSNSDVANNANVSRRKISSVSFPLSIDALLKVLFVES